MNADDREHQAEHWLDAALSRYSDVQPRPGLEQRILANLEARQRARRHWWHWAWAPAAAVFIISAVSLWMVSRPEPPVIVQIPTPPQRTEHAGLNPQIMPAPKDTVKPTPALRPAYRIELLVSEVADGKPVKTRTYTLTARERQSMEIDTIAGRVRVSPLELDGNLVLTGDAKTAHQPAFNVPVRFGDQSTLTYVEDPTTKKQYQVNVSVMRIR